MLGGDGETYTPRNLQQFHICLSPQIESIPKPPSWDVFNALCCHGDEHLCYALWSSKKAQVFLFKHLFSCLRATAAQARDILTSKLSSWQDHCNDATDMPENVLTMIEGLRVPIPITPAPSPSPSRHSVVRWMHVKQYTAQILKIDPWFLYSSIKNYKYYSS